MDKSYFGRRFWLFVLLSVTFSDFILAQDDTSYILTPKAGPQPRINGAKIFGVRPSHPIVFTVAASGDRPMTFSATGLPKTVKLDSQTGRLSGVIPEPGTYVVKVTAKNKFGKAERDFKLVVGEEIALTPPMGWNSYNIFGTKITQDIVFQQANAMANSELINHGWTFINIDDGWQGFRGGPFHAIMPDSTRFTDIKLLCDEVHALGLKIGTYSTPWVESYGHRIGGSSTNAEGIFVKRTGESSPRNKKVLPYAIGPYSFVKMMSSNL